MSWDYGELAFITILSIAYIIPGSIMIKKYKNQMDTFSLWMILIYIIGFIMNIVFLWFDIWVKSTLIEVAPDDLGCDYLNILEQR